MSLPVVRSGECSRCGDCCADVESPDGWCPELLPQNALGERLCRQHDAPKRRCGDNGGWPYRPQNLYHLPRCTYHFAVE